MPVTMAELKDLRGDNAPPNRRESQLVEREMSLNYPSRIVLCCDAYNQDRLCEHCPPYAICQLLGEKDQGTQKIGLHAWSETSLRYLLVGSYRAQ